MDELVLAAGAGELDELDGLEEAAGVDAGLLAAGEAAGVVVSDPEGDAVAESFEGVEAAVEDPLVTEALFLESVA